MEGWLTTRELFRKRHFNSRSFYVQVRLRTHLKKMSKIMELADEGTEGNGPFNAWPDATSTRCSQKSPSKLRRSVPC